MKGGAFPESELDLKQDSKYSCYWKKTQPQAPTPNPKPKLQPQTPNPNLNLKP